MRQKPTITDAAVFYLRLEYFQPGDDDERHSEENCASTDRVEGLSSPGLVGYVSSSDYAEAALLAQTSSMAGTFSANPYLDRNLSPPDQ